MAKPKSKATPAKSKPAPVDVKATQTFRHGTIRVIEGQTRSSDDPIVAMFPSFFETPTPARSPDTKDD